MKLVDPFVWRQLQKRLDVVRDERVQDIYDGLEYRKIERKFSSENKAYVTLLCNTDGVQIYNSSKYSIWPIWLIINELPPSQR